MSDGPRFTIITACFNASKTLPDALRSLREQTYRDFEHIVIDGGSRDGTADLLRAHSAELAYWVSEPDKGIADAWNKGLARARGSLVGILNADDMYHPETLAIVAAALRPEERALTYGITRWFESDPAGAFSESSLAFDPEKLAYGFGFLHTTCFVPRRIYDEIGGFDTRYRIAIDSDFLLRCHFRGVGFRQAGNITYMRTGGLSQRRQTQAYLEYLSQLYREGYPRLRLLRGLLSHGKRRFLGAAGKP